MNYFPWLIYIVCFFALLLAQKVGFCAGPIAHHYLAEQWLKCHPLANSTDEQAFIIGNLFPDIRYIGDIARGETHVVGGTIEDIIAASSPFMAGMRWHALVDELRETLVIATNIYSSIASYAQGYNSTLLKLIEDEILYDRVDRARAVSCLFSILEQEIEWGVQFKTVAEWHLLLLGYFTIRPSLQLKLLAKGNLPFLNVPSHIVELWSRRLGALAKEDKLIAHVKQMLEQLEKVLKKNLIQSPEQRFGCLQDSLYNASLLSNKVAAISSSQVVTSAALPTAAFSDRNCEHSLKKARRGDG